MPEPSPRRLLPWFDFLPHVASVIAITVGALVLAGWVFDVMVFKRALPALADVRINTAASFILSGVALLGVTTRAGRPFRIAAQVCSAVVLMLALLSIAEYLSGMNLGLDPLFGREIVHLPDHIRGGFSFVTAISLAGQSAAILLLGMGKARLVTGVHILTAIPIILSCSALIGYAYGVNEFLREELSFTPIPLYTAAVLLLLTLGIITTRAEYPLPRFVTSANPAGIMVRRVLPAAILFTLVLGWVIERAYRIGYLSGILTLAVFTAVAITGLVIMILWGARALYRAGLERDQTEDQLRAASHYASSLIEASLDPLVMMSPEGKIVDVNEAAVRATGVPREASFGTDISDYFTESARVRAALEEVLAKGVVTDLQLSLRHTSGSVMEVLCNGSVYRDRKGEIVGVLAAARDITARKRAEDALQEREERLRLIAETIQDVFWISTPGIGQMLYISPAYERMWERSCESLYRDPKSLVEPVHPDDLPEFNRLRELHAKGEAYEGEYRIVRHDGEIRWMHERGFPVRNHDGSVRAMTGVVSDATVRRKAEAGVRASEELFRALADATSEGMLIHEHGRIVEINRQMEDILRRPRAEVIGISFLKFVAPAWLEMMSSRVETPQDTRIELAFVRPDGSEVYVSSLAHSCAYQGRMMRVAAYRDITLEKRAEEALRTAGQYNRSLIEVSLDPLVTISPDGKIIDVNESTLAATGIPRTVLIGSDFSICFAERDKARAAYEEVFSKGFIRDYPLSIFHVSGKVTEVLCNAAIYRDAKGNVAGAFAAARDITERKKLERELERQAHIDLLTDLTNRRFFLELSEHELTRARRHGEPLSLLMMDLDKFKAVNDTYGHAGGDTVLQKLAEVCRATFREADIIGRLGGEEFAALLPETAPPQAMEMAERLRQAVERAEAHLEDGNVLHFTVSIGVAPVTAEDDRINSALKRADTALYQAKSGGRNRVCLAGAKAA